MSIVSRCTSFAFMFAACILLTLPVAAAPELAPLEDQSLLANSPLHLALNASHPAGSPLTFTVESSDPTLVTPSVLEGNRSLGIRVAGYGEMVFELFEQRVPRATSRIVELAESGFYAGVLFHRVMNGFVIQGGDPTGTGSGGSELGPFDDQYHVDLQHNRRGILSMAKAGDDTNDSQFFITEVSTRHLDFNHSIFGLLTVGEVVREAISEVPVDSDARPLADILIEEMRVFEDTQNAVLMLEAPEGTTGAATVTVTVTDDDGLIAQQTITVSVTPDSENSPPFLADIPVLSTPVNTPFTYQLQAVDVEGDPSFFLDENTLSGNGLQAPVLSHGDLDYQVDFDTGLLTVTPSNGLSGLQSISVAAGVNSSAIDYQIVTIDIGGESAPPE